MDVTLLLNYSCNLNCLYCYNYFKNNESVKIDVIRKSVSLAFESLEPYIAFFGGEPLLEFEKITYCVGLARELQRVTQRKPRFALTTNGTILTDYMRDFFVNEHFHVVVSIDGCPEAHNLMRLDKMGNATFLSVEGCIKKCVNSIFLFETNTVINPSTLKYLPMSLEYLIQLGVKKINFTLNNGWPWSDVEVEELEYWLDKMADMYLKKKRESYDFYVDIFDSRMFRQPCSCSGDWECGFNQNEICVVPNGDLYPCERIAAVEGREMFLLGNIYNSVDFEKTTQLRDTILEAGKECVFCDFRSRCNRSCGCSNYFATGNIGKLSSLNCRFEKILIKITNRIMESCQENG